MTWFDHIIRTSEAQIEVPTVALTSVTGVEIATVGSEWKASTGPFTVTEEDLQSVIASQADPTIKSPRVKLGHLDPRFTPEGSGGIFDGIPAFGRFENLRLTSNGQTLVGDIVGIPQWVADVAPYAWPTRSGEWVRDYTSDAGKQYPLVLPAVALGGVWLPAISTIEDLPALFTAEGPEGVQLVMDAEKIRASRGDVAPVAWGVEKPKKVLTAGVSESDVRRSFFEDFATKASGRYWWWPHQIFLSPTAVIAEDEDTNDLFFVTYEITEDGVVWGEPVGIEHQYVDSENGTVLAGRKPDQVYTSAASARPSDRIRTKEQTMGVNIGLLRERLGLSAEDLPDDATEEQVNAVLQAKPEEPEAVTEEQKPEAKKEEEPQPVATSRKEDPDVVPVDRETYDRLIRTAEKVDTLEADKAKERREKVVAEAIRTGRIAPSRKDAWLDRLEKDPGDEATLTSLEPGLIPVTEEGVNPSPSEDTAQQGTGLFPHLYQKQEA